MENIIKTEILSILIFNIWLLVEISLNLLLNLTFLLVCFPSLPIIRYLKNNLLYSEEH